VFNASASLKQLGTIIDRLTHIGSCELLLEPGRVSLKATMETRPPAIAGIIIERQLNSLNGMVQKDGVRRLGVQLLLDAKSIYREDTMPIRRARVLVRSLNLVYHTQEVGIDSPEEVAKEAERLLTNTVSPGL
jgi:separase